MDGEVFANEHALEFEPVRGNAVAAREPGQRNQVAAVRRLPTSTRRESHVERKRMVVDKDAARDLSPTPTEDDELLTEALAIDDDSYTFDVASAVTVPRVTDRNSFVRASFNRISFNTSGAERGRSFGGRSTFNRPSFGAAQPDEDEFRDLPPANNNTVVAGAGSILRNLTPQGALPGVDDDDVAHSAREAAMIADAMLEEDVGSSLQKARGAAAPLSSGCVVNAGNAAPNEIGGGPYNSPSSSRTPARMSESGQATSTPGGSFASSPTSLGAGETRWGDKLRRKEGYADGRGDPHQGAASSSSADSVSRTDLVPHVPTSPHSHNVEGSAPRDPRRGWGSERTGTKESSQNVEERACEPARLSEPLGDDATSQVSAAERLAPVSPVAPKPPDADQGHRFRRRRSADRDAVPSCDNNRPRPMTQEHPSAQNQGASSQEDVDMM